MSKSDTIRLVLSHVRSATLAMREEMGASAELVTRAATLAAFERNDGAAE